MFYKNVIKILDKSRENKDEIFVARDKIIAEESISFKEIKPAYDFIVEFYETITKCRRMNDNQTIKCLAEAVEKDDVEAIKVIVDEVSKRVEN